LRGSRFGLVALNRVARPRDRGESAAAKSRSWGSLTLTSFVTTRP